MYYTIKDVFMYGKSMKGISERWNQEQGTFKDIDALGLFVDNHDNARFLNGKNDWKAFKQALAFSLTARGIPFFYYGSEQGFTGGNDPQNREAMWNSFNEDHELFKFTQAIMKSRSAEQAYDH